MGPEGRRGGCRRVKPRFAGTNLRNDPHGSACAARLGLIELGAFVAGEGSEVPGAASTPAPSALPRVGAQGLHVRPRGQRARALPPRHRLRHVQLPEVPRRVVRQGPRTSGATAVSRPAPPSGTEVSVVVAAHTMDRWDDIVAGMRRAGAPDRAAAGDDPGRGPQRAAAGPRSRRVPRRTRPRQRAHRGCLRRPQHRHRPGQGVDHRLRRRRREAGAGLDRAAARGVRRPRGHGRGRRGVAGVALPASGPPATGAGLDRRLHLPGAADRARRRAQPVGLQHVGAARGVRPGRQLRRGDRPDRADPDRLRGDRALHPDRPAAARRPGWSSSRARWSTTGSPRPGRRGPTCAPGPTPRASRRRRSAPWWAPRTRSRSRPTT